MVQSRPLTFADRPGSAHSHADTTKVLSTRLEIVPTDGIVAIVQANIPVASTLTITCLPHHGIEPTMQTAVELGLLGFNVVPHLAARSLEGRAQLAGILRGCEAVGITEVFAVGGDAAHAAGPYDSAVGLMVDIAEMSGGRIAIGVAGHPEGHPKQNPLHMLDALLEKQHLAANIVTQMCFSAAKIGWYAELLRREGVELPLWAGVAGAVPRTQLVSLAIKIGVGPSLRFLSGKGPLARRLLSGGAYSSQGLVSELSAIQPALAGIHLYTFNNLGPSSAKVGNGPGSVRPTGRRNQEDADGTPAHGRVTAVDLGTQPLIPELRAPES
ncbi:methylenetetrahydrofolate reductase [Paenarthrobacter sp. Z7-10]|uniref:methylenetetrahydrofolate reductase n=1 Tax=Paenarthrobacter sp. Z7-10 TaxID=2787635 RepID=UPI0022A93C36|nr:methylenetetrahydrofolate reductase [Paenarthrobacter sp. Z7-10]MCZ2402999.1 methylenetetrahydrofolate reductase [Paenarthrobacter sp. Z7-10]